MDTCQVLEEMVKAKSKFLFSQKVDLTKIVIEKRVHLKCFHCKNYKNKWTCPPNIPAIDYKELFLEYENGLLVYCKIPYSSKEEFDIIRVESTNLVHQALLEAEKELYIRNCSLAVSFIGGSCKKCKDGCSKDSCRFPEYSRIPLEATGVNVIKFVKETVGIEIKFPPEKALYRFGLLVW